MRNPFEKVVPICLASALLATALHAAVVPGRWEKVEQLPLQSPLRVVLVSGDRIQGRLSSTNPDAIIVTDLGGAERELPKSSVRKVLLVGGPFADSLWDGLLVGGAVGAGTYLIGHAALCCAPNEGHDLGGAAFFAAVGVGIGLLSDRAKKSDELVVYRAP